jgi:hypothetical protein
MQIMLNLAETAFKRAEEIGNRLRPCPIMDHHKIALEKIRKYGARPEDGTTEKWLYDEEVHKGLIEFDEQLEKLLNPFGRKYT